MKAINLFLCFFFLPLPMRGESKQRDLHYFEKRLNESPQVISAKANLVQKKMLLKMGDAEGGWRFVGNTALNAVKEPLSGGSVRDYDSASVQLGISHPILGSQVREKEKGVKAKAQVDVARAQLTLTRREVLKDIRKFYVQYWGTKQKLELSQAFLSTKASVSRLLTLRRKEDLLLEADRREFMTAYSMVRRDMARVLSEQQFSLSSLNLVAQTSLFDFDPIRPLLPFVNEDLQRVLGLIHRHPELEFLRAQVEENVALYELVKKRYPESEMRLVQNLSQDFPGEMGYSTSLSFNFSLPLRLSKSISAHKSYLHAILRKLKKDFEYKRKSLRIQAQRGWNTYQANQKNVQTAQDRLSSAEEAVRVAFLRAQFLEGDTLEKMQQSLYHYYQVGIDMIDAETQVLLDQADLLSLTGKQEEEASRIHLELFNNYFWQEALGKSNPHAMGKKDRLTFLKDSFSSSLIGSSREPANLEGFGLYVWNATNLRLTKKGFKNHHWKSLWRQWGRGKIHTVMLSFKKEEIEKIRNDSLYSSALLQFVNLTKLRGFRVVLLLGEPTWILPQGRTDLIQIIRSLSALPFDGLHLDLEPAQLCGLRADLDGSSRLLELSRTLREVKALSPWSVSLSIHPDELNKKVAGKKFGRILEELNLDHVVLMIYVADPQKAARIARRQMKAYPGLLMAVAQSVERPPILNDRQSYASLGREKMYKKMAQLERLLIHFHNYIGIVIQDWDSLENMKS